MATGLLVAVVPCAVAIVASIVGIVKSVKRTNKMIQQLRDALY